MHVRVKQADEARRPAPVSLHAQLLATVAGFALCVLPAYVASTAPELVATLREAPVTTQFLNHWPTHPNPPFPGGAESASFRSPERFATDWSGR